MEGRCTCGAVTYALLDAPLITHCCHCTWCQRESGSAFAVNAMIETTSLRVSGPVEMMTLPSASGKGQEVARCANCKVTLFSHYAGLGRLSAFVRVGTMTRPQDCPPDVHIFVASKAPWVVLDQATPQFAEYYDRKTVWPAAAQARYEALKARR